MKQKRHSKILELIQKYDIDTQEMLQTKLMELGFEVTQATVSRDIKELKLVKTLSDTGAYKYSIPPSMQTKNPISSLVSLLSESVISVDNAINTVVIKCHIGMANAVCAKLDNASFHNIVGTLAGDDTIFVLFKSETEALDFVGKLNTLIKSR